MADKRIRYGANTLAFVALIFGILVLINFLSARRFVRLDLTEDKRYTVSKSTKDVIKNLDDIVTITVYFSTEPARVGQILQDIRDVLEEYNAFSRRLQIDYINPADMDDAEKQELRFKGIQEVPINVFEKDKAVIANVYMAISIGYSGKEEVLPVVQSTANLEYELTSTIVKVTTKDAKTVGFLTGHDEYDINAQTQANQQLRQLLDKNADGQYNITTVDLQPGEPVDPSVSTLVVAGPKQMLTETEKYEIDQFIMRGGRALFLIDPITIQPDTLQGTPLATGLNDLLQHYGIKLGNNVIGDRRLHDSVQFGDRRMTYIQPYIYWVKIHRSNFSKENSITSQLEELTLAWTSSIETVQKEGISATPLAKTTEFGQSFQGVYNLSPRTPIPPPTDLQVYTVAAALEGKFKSFYADKEIPTTESAADPEVENEDDKSNTPPETEDRTTITDSTDTQIIVVGTGEILTRLTPKGAKFFLNCIDWLTLGDTLIGIRSQSITIRPLNEISGLTKNFIKYLCTIGIPLLVVIIGLIRYLLKRRVKRLVGTYGSRI